MTNKISRSQWEQITGRVRRAEYRFDPNSKCLIDGRRFLGNDCPHTKADNEGIIATIQLKELSDTPH